MLKAVGISSFTCSFAGKRKNEISFSVDENKSIINLSEKISKITCAIPVL